VRRRILCSMYDLSTLIDFVQIASGCATVVGVPVVAYYTWETVKLRRTSQKQLEATRSPALFFDNPTRDIEQGWEGIDIVNGGGGPAVNVEYRLGDKGNGWVPIPALMSGERRKIPHEIGHMLDTAARNREPEATIYVRCRGWSGELHESNAKLGSMDGVTFQLTTQNTNKI
jgi:hypothetical protein